MAQAADGTVIRSVKQVDSGDEITVQLSDGRISATVIDGKENVV